MTPESRRLTRVTLLTSDLSRAGAETQLVALARSLEPAKYQVDIVLLKERNDLREILEEAGIPVTALRRGGWWDVGVLWRLYRHLRRARPDILHCFLFLANLMGAVAGHAVRVPCLIVSQRSSYEATLPRAWRRLARWIHTLADRVIVNSQAARREEIEAGFPEDRIVYVPSGIGRQTTPEVSRDQLGLPGVL